MNHLAARRSTASRLNQAWREIWSMKLALSFPTAGGLLLLAYQILLALKAHGDGSLLYAFAYAAIGIIFGLGAPVTVFLICRRKP